jgi:hypothetical protein
MKKGDKTRGLLISIFLIATQVHAADILETVGGLNNLVYGIAAGLAALMITLHAIRWKTADSPSGREEAKRGMINVILALILIMVAGALISVIYVQSPEAKSATTTRIPTTHSPTTTAGATSTTSMGTTTTTTTTTSTTTTTLDPTLLTAANLANCIKNGPKAGMLYTDPPNCHFCLIEENLWATETPPVGPGASALASITQSSSWSNPCGGMPCWKTKTSQSLGCKNFISLNTLYGCGLTVVPLHTYKSC